ncbi:MAG: FAD-dependent oxidoreductase [Candidatus Omnitrophica bacterium]|nr:FAD-dependent oxidoreductase [Candidatus Omnitrophota bacterium]
MKRLNISQLESLQAKAINRFASAKKIRVRICITGCRANGALELLECFKQQIKEKNLNKKIQVVPTGCQKFCSGAPVVSVDLPSFSVMYQKIGLSAVKEIIETTIKKEKVVSRFLLPQNRFFDFQMVKISKNCGYINPLSFEEYLSQNGFSGLRRVLTSFSPENVIAEIKASRLRGRGGAGFPTGLKWEFVRNASGSQKYVICNGDEGDPGAFMDRALLEGCPYQVIEGIIICAYAVGASQGIVYVRAEYPVAVEHLRFAINECYKYGLLGNNILGTGFSFDLQIKEGAGAFVCGEETALIASIEGKRGMPRPRPPFPAQEGLWNKPTCINNVETFANIPIIIQEGGENFARVGTSLSGGTKLFSLAGKVRNTGLVEVPLGISLGRLLFDIGGGALPGRTLKGVQIGGPSGGCLPVSRFNTPVDYETITGLGAIMGSGGIIGVDDKVCMVEFARYFIDFVQKESCGKCVPCRVGTKRILEILSRITQGYGKSEDLSQLKELAETLKQASLCGLGQTACNPVLTTLLYFENEYKEHIFMKYCRAGQCKELVYTPCENACPSGVKVSDYVAAIRARNFEEAFNIIAEDIPFPSICGRICYHPCESACKRAEIDQPVAVCSLKRFVADYARKENLSIKKQIELKPLLRKHVAIVGGGPCGLTCAWVLSREGINVSLFEKEYKLGGMLRYYVPEFRLPANVLEKEIKDILNPRIRLYYGKSFGKNLSLQSLEKHFDAVFLAPGASQIQRLGIPGENLPNVYQGLDFLRKIKSGKKIDPGKKVGIIGGGNVAIDCARSVLRIGAEDVSIFYRRTSELMPAHKWEIEEAEKERIKFRFLLVPLEIRKCGKLLEILFQKCQLTDVFDDDGRRKILEVKGEIISFVLDTLIIAVGQKSLFPMFFKNRDVDRFNLMLSGSKIFLGGDFLRGPSTVVEAIGDGKKAGFSILKHICGILPEEQRRFQVPWNLQKKGPVNLPRQRPESIPLEQRRVSFAEVEKTFSIEKAIKEANRCLFCQLEK